MTNTTIEYPPYGGNVQVEPEMAIWCEIVYSEAEEKRGIKKVQALIPRKVAAFNDCSMRALDGSVI